MRLVPVLVLLAGCGAPADPLQAPPGPEASTSARSTAWVHAFVEVTDDGVRLITARTAGPTSPHATRAPAAGTVSIRDAEGAILATATVPDHRHTSIIAPEGGGEHVLLDRSVVRVSLPWPTGAVTVEAGGVARSPAGPVRTPPTAVIDAGPASERLDLLMLGDGYTAAEQATFDDDVDRMVAHLLSLEPFGAYADLFNVWKVFEPSAGSGVDDPSTGVFVDTRYDCAYDCAGIDRLICCSDTEVAGQIATSLPDTDGTVVLVNDAQYGGSGGSLFATSYTGTAWGEEVFAHEMGHSLLGLWDEYSYGTPSGGAGGPNCDPSDTSPVWADWLGDAGIGAHLVCSHTDLFRPTDTSCMMNVLQDDYCAVCREHAVREIYGRLPGLLATTTPPEGLVPLLGPTVFSATTLLGDLGAAGPWQWTWLLDGAVVSTDPTLTLDACTTASTLTLELVDPTDWVRTDPDQRLSDVATWTLSTAGTCDGDGDGFTAVQGDCDDADPSVNPAATDVAGDGVDADCDGAEGPLTVVVGDLVPGQPADLAVIGAVPGETVWLLRSTTGATGGPCPALLGGLCVDLVQPEVTPLVADAQGAASLSPTLPATVPPVDVWFQAVTVAGPGPRVSPVLATAVQPAP